MVKQILRRMKILLDIEDDSQDLKLIYIIESSIFQIESYIHSVADESCIPAIVTLASHNYQSGESSGSGGGSATVGEVKKESYSGVSFEYTTSADFAKSSSSSSSGEANTYFNTMIAPMLQSRRRVQVVHSPVLQGDYEYD